MKKLLLALLFFFGAPVVLSAAPVHVAATDPVPCVNCTDLTYSVTVASGSNRALVVGVMIGHHCSGSGAVPTITSVTYGGVGMTAQNTVPGSDVGCSTYGRVAQYTLVAPTVGTADVVITMSGTAIAIHSTASTFTGVNQVTPVRSVASAAQFTNATTITATVPSFMASDLLVDAMCNGRSIIGPASGQTQRVLRNTSTSNTCDNAASSTRPGSSGGTMTWTVVVTTADVSMLSTLALEDAAVDATPPSNASGLAVTIVSSNALSGVFTAATDNQQLVYHSVERCSGTGCSSFSEILQLSSPATTFTDSGLTANTVYCYRVRGFDGTNYSVAYTSTACQTTFANQTVILTWQNNTVGTVPVVERRTGTGAYADLATKATNATTHTDTASPQGYSGTLACYRIRATLSGSPDSSPSSEVCTLPLANTILTQTTYQFGSYGGPETSPNRVLPINTIMTLPPNACTQLRVLLRNTGGQTEALTPVVYARRNGGGYAPVANGPCVSTGICFPSGVLVPPELGAVSTTEQLAGAGTFTAGKVQLTSSLTPTVTLTSGQDTEFVAALCTGASNGVGDVVDIQWRRNGGGLLEGYTQTPQLLIGGYSGARGSR